MKAELTTASIQKPSFRSRRQRPKKPIFVFDMAFPGKNDRRFPSAVSGAALPLALRIKSTKLATPYFLEKPLTFGGAISLPKGLSVTDRQVIFGLSLYDNLFRETQAEVQEIKNHYPQAKIVIGGPSVSSAKDLSNLAGFFPEADALVRGEGEVVLGQVIKALVAEKPDKNLALPGTYLKTGKVDDGINLIDTPIFNSQPKIIAFPALVKDIKASGALRLHTSRGCLYRCVFCVADKLHRRPIAWTAERIVEELRHIKDLVQRGILPQEAKHIHFDDDDFFFDKKRAKAFLLAVIADPGLKNYFTFSFQGGVRSFYRVKTNHIKSKVVLDKELIDLLERLKVGLNLGTDGFHDETLRYLGKPNYSVEMAVALARKLAKRGISQRHYVILTTPETTLEIIEKTLLNMVDLMLVGWGKIAFKINFGLTAFESSRLEPKLKKIAKEKDIVTNPAGSKKYLPLLLPNITDKNCVSVVNAALKQKIYRRVVERYWVKMGSAGVQKARARVWKKALPHWKKLKSKTLLEAINSRQSALQLVALDLLLMIVSLEVSKRAAQKEKQKAA